MEWVKNYQLFFFDFDGLLLDTEPLQFVAYIEMCKIYGVSLSWDFSEYCSIAHYNATGLRNRLYEEFPELRKIPWEELYDTKRQLYTKIISKTPVKLMPGVEKFLTFLQAEGLNRAVVTHSMREHMEIFKNQHPILKTIPNWLTKEDYCMPKPNPDCYLMAIDKFASQGDKIMAFEDSYRGLAAIKEAGGIEPVLVNALDYEKILSFINCKITHFKTFDYINKTQVMK